jgi:aminoglycoside phosphotransferase (APT) family kinase protein
MFSPQLNVERVKEIIEEQFPTLEVTSIFPVQEGGDASTFEVNGAIIFRFATSDKHAARLSNEAKVVNVIRNKLPIQLPQFNYIGEPSKRFRFHFLGHKKIAGISGEQISPNFRYQEDIVRNLGEFLSTLHSCSLEAANERLLETKELESPERLLEKANHYTKSVNGFLDNKSVALQQFLNGEVIIPSNPKSRFVLSHADLKGEHILLSKKGDKIVGIIDWTDICFTDPTVDFRGILIWSGREFVERTLKYYALPMDDEFLNRILFYTRCNALYNLGERIAGQSDAPLDLLVNQLKRAFS